MTSRWFQISGVASANLSGVTKSLRPSFRSGILSDKRSSIFLSAENLDRKPSEVYSRFFERVERTEAKK